jgi:Flp/Fap pilin component.
MEKLANWFLSEESGQGMVEYALILALIAVVLIGVLGAVSGTLQQTFQNIVDKLGAANAAGSNP